MSSAQFSSVCDAIEDKPAEVANMRLRSALIMALEQHIKVQGCTQAEAARLLSPDKYIVGRRDAVARNRERLGFGGGSGLSGDAADGGAMDAKEACDIRTAATRGNGARLNGDAITAKISSTPYDS